jgi:hypothetical protein
MPTKVTVFSMMAAVAAVVACYSLLQIGSARMAEGANAVSIEYDAVCKRLGTEDGSSERARCMGELNRLQSWHDQRREGFL